MSLSTLDNRRDYVGDGATVAFSLPILCYESTHVKVYLAGVLQVSGYALSGLGNPSGVTVTFTTAPASSIAVLLLRSVPVTQLNSYGVAGGLPAKTTEKALDLQTMVDQQQDETFGRAIKIPLSSTSKNIDIPDPANTANHGKVLRIASAAAIDVVAVQTTDFANPLTTKGDLVTRNSSIEIRLPVGADGEILEALASDASGLKWQPAA